MRNLTTLLFVLLFANLFSQEAKSDWISYQKVDGITINFKYVECNDTKNGIFQELVVFQFVNKSDKDVDLSFDLLLLYSRGGAKLSSESEQHRSIILKRNAVIESNCSDNREFTIFSKFLNYTDKSELDKFDINNIKITPIKF